MTRASVVIPARDAEDTLPRALGCLRDQETDFPYEVIVVDDGSRDRTADLAEQVGEPVRVVRQEPKGAASARNLGVRLSSGEAVAFCDADCFATRGWLSAGVRSLERADLVQGQVVPDPTLTVGPFDRSLWITHEVGLWEAANLFVARQSFERVGGFEEWVRPVAGKAIGEDVLFGWRAKRLGARSAFAAEALVHHAVFPRGPLEYVAERRRRVHFPEMAATLPELRKTFLHRRVFLDRRTQAFDALVAGAVAALWLRRPWPLIAGAPYLRVAGERASAYGRDAAKVATVDFLADLVGASALVRGSLRARTPVL